MSLSAARRIPEGCLMVTDCGVWIVDPVTQRGELLPETCSKVYPVADNGWLGIGGPLHVAQRVAAYLADTQPEHLATRIAQLRPLVESALADMNPTDAEYARTTLKMLHLGMGPAGCTVSVLEWQSGRLRDCGRVAALPTRGIDRDELQNLLRLFDAAVSRARTLAGLTRAAGAFVASVRERAGCVSSTYEIAMLLRGLNGAPLRWKSAPLSAEPDPLLVEVGAL